MPPRRVASRRTKTQSARAAASAGSERILVPQLAPMEGTLLARYAMLKKLGRKPQARGDGSGAGNGAGGSGSSGRGDAGASRFENRELGVIERVCSPLAAVVLHSASWRPRLATSDEERIECSSCPLNVPGLRLSRQQVVLFALLCPLICA